MGADYSQAQKDAINRYMKDKVYLKTVVSKETAEKVKEHMQKHGFTSMNQFLLHCIEKEMSI